MRVYLDGCFDLAHYGHMRAVKQARDLGSSLVVGVVSDEHIKLYKAPAVMTLGERCEMAGAIRGVDTVVGGVSHVPDETFVSDLQEQYGVSLVVHGDDDTTMPNGTDAYEHPKKQGMFWAVPRTPGISTTDIVRALLTGQPLPHCPLHTQIPDWDPKPDTVFVDGAFDCLHVGHVTFLKEARRHARYLVVGVHSEDTVRERRGTPPLMCMADRARTLLGCKYVDGVLLDTPQVVKPTFLQTIGASSVARGAVHETCVPDRDRYKNVASQLVYVLSPSSMTLGTLRARIFQNCDAYESKVNKSS